MESGNLQDMTETVLKSRGQGGGGAPGTAELLKQMVNVARRKQGRSREEWAEMQGSHVDLIPGALESCWRASRSSLLLLCGQQRHRRG